MVVANQSMDSFTKFVERTAYTPEGLSIDHGDVKPITSRSFQPPTGKGGDDTQGILFGIAVVSDNQIILMKKLAFLFCIKSEISPKNFTAYFAMT